MADPDRIEILSERELGLTLARLASQVLESAEDSRRLMLLGIPTRGVQLSRVVGAGIGAVISPRHVPGGH